MSTLRFENTLLPVFRFFDELFATDTPDDKIDRGQEEIAAGDTEHGEADILEGTAEKIREQADEKSSTE